MWISHCINENASKRHWYMTSQDNIKLHTRFGCVWRDNSHCAYRRDTFQHTNVQFGISLTQAEIEYAMGGRLAVQVFHAANVKKKKMVRQKCEPTFLYMPIYKVMLCGTTDQQHNKFSFFRYHVWNKRFLAESRPLITYLHLKICIGHTCLLSYISVCKINQSI
jgi:hypothetical protein